MSRKVLTGGFAVRKVALSSWLPHTVLVLLKTMVTGMERIKHFSLGDGGIGPKK